MAQVKAGGRGLTLTVCHTVVFYSNDFGLRTRLQAEDRTHRYGTTKPVSYLDLIAKNTLDEHLILKGLRKKKQLTDLVLGDKTLSWL